MGVKTRTEPAYVVIDGLSLYYSLAMNIMRRGVACLYSYQEVRKEVFKFMDYLTAKNIVVKCFCLDAIDDPDKVREHGKRVVQRGKQIQKSWDSSFTILR